MYPSMGTAATPIAKHVIAETNKLKGHSGVCLVLE